MSLTKSIPSDLVRTACIVAALLAGSSVSQAQGDGSRQLEPFTYDKTIRTTGELRPYRNLTIKSKLNENVDTFTVPEGKRVSKGDRLLQFDTTTYKIRLNRTRHRMNRARHQKEIARKTFRRKQSLREKDLISESEFDQAELEYKQARENYAIARSDYREAQRQFDYTSVESPFPGVLDRHLVELAEQVRQGEPLLKLLRLHPLKVLFEATPAERDYLEAGDTVYVTLGSGTRPAEITRLSHDVDPENGLYSLTATLPNSDRELIAGRTVRLSVPLYQVDRAVRIPLNFVDRSGERPRILLKDPDTGTIHDRRLEVVDYNQRFIVTRMNWPEAWRLMPGSVYTRTDS